MSIVIVLVFAVLACLGMPLAFTLGFASLAGLFMGSIDFVVMPQRMMHAIDSFPLISIPLFMVAGELMVEGGIMDRLVDFANSVVGRVHGGLAHVAVLTGALLASVSGSAVASASAIGSSMVPSLRKYYDDGYSNAVISLHDRMLYIVHTQMQEDESHLKPIIRQRLDAVWLIYFFIL